jgi:hypothetical protein
MVATTRPNPPSQATQLLDLIQALRQNDSPIRTHFAQVGLAKSRKLAPRTAAWYQKTFLTFSDAIAAVRREIWGHQISFMSRPRRDSIEIPGHIWQRMENALAFAA